MMTWTDVGLLALFVLWCAGMLFAAYTPAMWEIRLFGRKDNGQPKPQPKDWTDHLFDADDDDRYGVDENGVSNA